MGHESPIGKEIEDEGGDAQIESIREGQQIRCQRGPKPAAEQHRIGETTRAKTQKHEAYQQGHPVVGSTPEQ